MYVYVFRTTTSLLTFTDVYRSIRISSIMVNRITLNLKRASAQQKVITWGIATFEDHSGSSYHDTRSPEPSYLHNDIELGRIPR